MKRRGFLQSLMTGAAALVTPKVAMALPDNRGPYKVQWFDAGRPDWKVATIRLKLWHNDKFWESATFSERFNPVGAAEGERETTEEQLQSKVAFFLRGSVSRFKRVEQTMITDLEEYLKYYKLAHGPDYKYPRGIPGGAYDKDEDFSMSKPVSYLRG